MSFDAILDLGEIGEQTVTVEFDYQPAERQTHDDQGCPAEVTITAVTWICIDIRDDLSKDTISQLEQEAFKYMDDQRDSELADRAEYLNDLREAA